MSMADSRPFIMHNHVYKNEGIGLYLKDISTPKLMAGNNFHDNLLEVVCEKKNLELEEFF